MFHQKVSPKLSWTLLILISLSFPIFVLVDASIASTHDREKFDKRLLNVTPEQNNSTKILDQACQTDLDCYSGTSANDSSTLGNYACVEGRCKYVVAAGEQCNSASDCAAYLYYTRTNQSVDSSLCSSSNCNLNSKCDSAWDPQRFNSPPPPNFSGFMCCGGIKENDECLSVATNVDPCDYELRCVQGDPDNQPWYRCVPTQSSSVIIGVIICLFGGIILNIGLNIQKYAFTKHQEKFNEQRLRAESFNDEPVGGIDELIKQKRDSSTSLDTNGSMRGTGDNVEPSGWYKKLEKFMFWKQIVVSPLWVIGFLIYLFGTLMGFTALQFAPQSLIAPLGAVSLITNLLMAPILHSQKLTLFDIFGVIVIIGGSVVITIFSGTALQDYKLCVLIALFQRPSTIIYLSIITCFIAVLIFFIKLESRNDNAPNVLNDLSGADVDDVSKVLSASVDDIDEKSSDGLTDSTQVTDSNIVNRKHSIQEPFEALAKRVSSVLSITSTRESIEKSEKDINNVDRSYRNSVRSNGSGRNKRRRFKENFMLPIAYAVLASSMATLTTLFAKSLINLLSQTFVHHNNQFDNLISWIILMVTLVTAIGQVYWLNIGLKKYDALIQVPIFFCNWSIYDIIGGGIYYDEFKNFTTEKYFEFSLGVAIIFFGVVLLSKRLAKLSKEEEELNARQKSIEMEIKKMKHNRNAKSEKV